MFKQEWFRKESWSAADAADFFAHLARARRGNRAQYLRLQAGHLQKLGSTAELSSALELLALLLREYPEQIELQAAHSQRAECLEALQRVDEAQEAWQQAINSRRAFPNVDCNVHTSYGLFVLRHGLEARYEEALAVLEEFTHAMPMPILIYEYSLAKALLLKRLGRVNEARLSARSAVQAVTRTESDFRYHRLIGLVARTEPGLHEELESLLDEGG